MTLQRADSDTDYRTVGTASLMPASRVTCATTNCTYSGTELYPYESGLLCGHCADSADNAAMPYITSEFSWGVLRGLDR